jgi:hypothetical protein
MGRLPGKRRQKINGTATPVKPLFFLNAPFSPIDLKAFNDYTISMKVPYE